MNQQMQQPLELKQIFIHCLKVYQQNILTFIVLGLLGNSLFIFSDISKTAHFDLLVSALSWIVMTWAVIASVLLSEKALNGETISLKDIKFIDLSGFAKVFIAVLIYFAVMMGGLILFIVPGIIWAVFFTFFYLPIILEHKGIVEGYKMSKKLVKGYFWSIFFITFLIGLSAGILEFIPHPFKLPIRWGISGVFGLGFCTLLEVAVYLKLKQIKG